MAVGGDGKFLNGDSVIGFSQPIKIEQLKGETTTKTEQPIRVKREPA